MSIILYDTETTGLLKPEGTALNLQPHIIEFFGITIDDQRKKVRKKFHTLVKPPIPISEKITKITGITNEMVADAPVFTEVYQNLTRFFFGCHTLVAHNAPFDIGMIANELRRLDKLLKFPWPPIHYCTVEQSMWIKGHRLKLQKLYEIATGKPEIEGAHRAEDDTMALFECYKWLKEQEEK